MVLFQAGKTNISERFFGFDPPKRVFLNTFVKNATVMDSSKNLVQILVFVFFVFLIKTSFYGKVRSVAQAGGPTYGPEPFVRGTRDAQEANLRPPRIPTFLFYSCPEALGKTGKNGGGGKPTFPPHPV